jgi:hypothetical protein
MIDPPHSLAPQSLDVGICLDCPTSRQSVLGPIRGGIHSVVRCLLCFPAYLLCTIQEDPPLADLRHSSSPTLNPPVVDC